MLPSTKGAGYISRVYRFAPEVTGILLGDEALRRRAKALLLQVQPSLESLVMPTPAASASVLSAVWAQEALTLLDDLERRASPELKAEIVWWRVQLPHLVGKSAREIWSFLPARSPVPFSAVDQGPEHVILQDEPRPVRESYSRLLSRIRDEMLLRRQGGAVYVALVYRYAPEVTGILLRDAALRRRAQALLVQARPGLEACVGEKAGAAWTLSQDWVAQADRLLQDLTPQASPTLAGEIQWWQQKLPRWVGKTPQQVWDELLKEPRGLWVTPSR